MSIHHDPLSHHKKAYFVVWMTLIVLTVITVWTAYQDYGVLNIVVAMFIASVKACLVILYFMHLKYDNRLNQVVFASAFVFLAVFIGLTLSDELARPNVAKASVEAMPVPAGAQASLHEALRTATPELVAKGKEIYLVQCQTCHGAAGLGDGPAAGALNPKPRNFTSGEWKQGGTPTQVFKTVTDGITGTGMASFASMDVKDRWAVVHYIRSLSPNTPADTPETLAATGLGGSGSPAAEQPSVRLPLDFTIEQMVRENK